MLSTDVIPDFRRNCFGTAAVRGLCGLMAVVVLSGTLAGQDQYRRVPVTGTWHPLSHNDPPGKAAGWWNAIHRYDPSWMQPIRVEIPGEGLVSIFSAAESPSAVLVPPAQFSVNVGHVYRLKLAEMPEFPGVEVYPTIEILDRLHPPMGRENDYPIPVVITAEDLRTAMSGQLVTRVVYLEQPQIAAPLDPLRADFPQSVDARGNALVEADRRGRPMLILRIGGRTPTPGSTPVSFYGTGGAVDASAGTTAGDLAAARRNSNPRQQFAAASRSN